MLEFIAVNDSLALFNIASLKREALMFDRIALPLFKSIAEEVADNSPTQRTIAEVEWLMDRGIVFEPEATLTDERLAASEEFRSFVNISLPYHAKLSEFTNLGAASTEVKLTTEWQRQLENQLAICGLNARYFSIQLRVLNNLDAYPVLSASIPPIESPVSKKSDVIQIALNSLPIPDYSSPWEQIVEYRSDEDSYHKFLDLRNWMSEVARSELSPLEIEQKLEHLLSQYQRHMSLHKMKTNPGVLQTIVVASAELIENLVKFNWGKVARSLFTLKQRRIATMEGELITPGSEVAYIIKARDAFS